MPFGNFIAARRQQRHIHEAKIVQSIAAGFKFLHFCTRHNDLQENKCFFDVEYSVNRPKWFSLKNNPEADVMLIR